MTTQSTFYHDGYADAGRDLTYRNFSAPDVPVYAQEYEKGYLDRIIDDRGCSRDVARIRAGVGYTSDGHKA